MTICQLLAKMGPDDFSARENDFETAASSWNYGDRPSENDSDPREND